MGGGGGRGGLGGRGGVGVTGVPPWPPSPPSLQLVRISRKLCLLSNRLIWQRRTPWPAMTIMIRLIEAEDRTDLLKSVLCAGFELKKYTYHHFYIADHNSIQNTCQI